MREAPADPEKRLRAFIEEECVWAERMGGMYLLLQYPLSSAGSHVIVSENYGEKMQDIFDYHLALLATTVVDLRSEKLSSLDFDEDSIPAAALLLHPAEVIASGHVAWMTHGLASWSTGQHTATRKMPTRGIKGLTVGIARSSYVDQIIKVARGQ
jgi:hypothetical protein